MVKKQVRYEYSKKVIMKEAEGKDKEETRKRIAGRR